MHEIIHNSTPLTDRNQNVYLFVTSSITQLLIGRGKLNFKNRWNEVTIFILLPLAFESHKL